MDASILGASPFVISSRAFPGPHSESGRGLRPLFLRRPAVEGWGRAVADKSEKLAQEGLRRDRDRLAVGERIRAGVRKVSHDLKGVCGSRRFLHQYQTDLWVRIVNTKLTDSSEWYDGFHNPAGDLALSFSRRRQGGGQVGKARGR